MRSMPAAKPPCGVALNKKEAAVSGSLSSFYPIGLRLVFGEDSRCRIGSTRADAFAVDGERFAVGT